jgi:hypothetical protein
VAQSVNRAKVDANQKVIVEALRAAGCFVQSLAGIGAGCPDLLVGTCNYNGQAYDGQAWVVMEVKDGSKPPSERKLTGDEIEWHRKANQCAPVWIVYDEIGALWVCGKTSEVPKIKPIRMVE